MATPRLFRLKAEVVARPQEKPATNFPIARVWVDTGVFHLDTPFAYSVPENLSDHISTGVRVQVPFGGREVEGIVIERCQESLTSGRIRAISKLLSAHPVATKGSLELIEAVAQRWATHAFDVIRLAIPPRVAAIDKTFIPQAVTKIPNRIPTSEQSFYAFDPFENPAQQILTLIEKASKKGSVLVVAPDEKDLNEIESLLEVNHLTYLRLDSSCSRAKRYENYLKAINSKNCIVLGARSAILTPVANLQTIIVYKESSHEHFEPRSPGFNVRDIAFIRRSMEAVDVIFAGFVPSMELSLMIDTKQLRFINHAFKLNVKAFSSEDGTLLPGRIFTDIRKALNRGPVLFVLPRKGYGNALLCGHCKNLAQCSCGGRLSIGARNAPPICTVCATVFSEWSCTWCNRSKPYIAGRGIERAAEEISRAFTGFPLILSFGDVIKASVEASPALVLATPGAAPRCARGYSAVVILEGIKFFSHPDIRAQERARELFFESAAMIDTKGSVLLSIPDAHPVTAAISKWNPGAMIRRELVEREEVSLPPFVQSILITCPAAESSQLVSGIHKAIVDSRLPSSVKVLGPTPSSKGLSKIVLYSPDSQSAHVRRFIHELQRRRSIAKKELLTVRVDPYSL